MWRSLLAMNHRPIRILLVGSNLWYIGEGMFGPLLSVYSERIGGNLLDLTWAWSMYLFVTGLCTLGIGALTDRWRSPERLMVAGYVLNALCTFAYLLVATPMHLLLVQASLGVASALASPTWNVLYAAYTPPQQAGTLWGAAQGQSYLITGIAILLGGYIVYLGSFTLLFAVMGVTQVAAAIYQSQILREPAPMAR
ncbi:MAG: MFS transporter [Roseiflexaceae bacterium]